MRDAWLLYPGREQLTARFAGVKVEDGKVSGALIGVGEITDANTSTSCACDGSFDDSFDLFGQLLHHRFFDQSATSTSAVVTT